VGKANWFAKEENTINYVWSQRAADRTMENNYRL